MLFLVSVAVSWKASLTRSVSFFAFNVTFFGAVYTCTWQVADSPLWVVTVTVAWPAFRAVTRPVSLTRTTFLFDVVKATRASRPSSKLAVSCAVPFTGIASAVSFSATQVGAGPPNTRTAHFADFPL